jgi:hypothetical protein
MNVDLEGGDRGLCEGVRQCLNGGTEGTRREDISEGTHTHTHTRTVRSRKHPRSAHDLLVRKREHRCTAGCITINTRRRPQTAWCMLSALGTVCLTMLNHLRRMRKQASALETELVVCLSVWSLFNDAFSVGKIM